MLNTIKIKNFQVHRHIILDLHKGINAITGTSDAGKSSIVRAIKFLATNRPRGTAFISHNKTKTEIAMEFDGVTVSRKRGKGINSYELGNQSFNVVKSDVPEEVTQFLNFSETTIQSQHDKYFLLQDSAGEVAKKLNKVANLDIIDYVMKEVNKKVRETQWKTTQAKEKIEGLETDIEKYEHLETVEPLLASLGEKTQKHTALADLWWDMDTACRKVESTEEILDDLNSWLEIEEPFIALIQLGTKFGESLITRQNLNNVIDEIEVSKERIRGLSEQAEYEEMVEGILRYALERERLTKDVLRIEELLYSTELEREIIAEKSLDIEDLTKDAVSLVKENKLCPLCGGKVDTNVLKHIKEWI
jgi:DNA repair protein SbcC/Rad50